MQNYYIFTDGAAKNNQGNNTIGGFGVFYPENPELNISKTIKGYTTNNIAELSAVYYGLKKFISGIIIKKQIIIVTDSMYLINSITKWAKSWEKNNWKKSDNKPIKNLQLVKKIYYLVNNLNIKFQHQRSHTKEPKDKTSQEYFFWYGNEQADKLAQPTINL